MRHWEVRRDKRDHQEHGERGGDGREQETKLRQAFIRLQQEADLNLNAEPLASPSGPAYAPKAFDLHQKSSKSLGKMFGSHLTHFPGSAELLEPKITDFYEIFAIQSRDYFSK